MRPWCPSPRRSRSPLETQRSTEGSLRTSPTTLLPSTGSCSAVCTSWSSWTTCSTGSAAAGKRPTWSCCCSAAARSRTGWPPRCCSARPRASARSCSRSSSRSRPCECGGRGVLASTLSLDIPGSPQSGLPGPLLASREKLPGKFKNLFRKFENLTDPCRNHKSYREVISKMKPPVIPFVPLILKDLTFLHEGSKTLVDGLVNIEKLHSVAERVRTVRKYRSRPLCLDMEASPHHLQTKAYVRQFQVIDNQNLLFELSYKLEANSQ
eukprot:bmy_13557T0